MPDGALLINTRSRVVWTTDERKLLSRLAKIFNMHGDKLLFYCGNAACVDPTIRMERDGTAPGGVVLRCFCTDRHFVASC